MKKMNGKTRFLSGLFLSLAMLGTGCNDIKNPFTNTAEPTPVAQNTPIAPVATPTATPNPIEIPVTLPVLDAMFADENFAAELKTKLNLTDEQIANLKRTARDATAALGETESEQSGSTLAAKKRAAEQIQGILGDEKAKQLVQLVGERWATGGETPTVAASNTATNANAVPTDTRVVVNAPAYRMDVFKDGQLVRTYKIGIGYPEFPLPTGMRTAKEIIFNPTWTPPDEPWVKGKLKPFQKVEAGSPLNPLGPIKIPIGLPSLIHGGKQAARLGSFASHGCVGLTNPQVQDFAYVLAQVSGTDLTNEDVDGYAKNKKETKNVKLTTPMPIELRYETIVVEDGKLKIYRDVYEHGTNTEENLRKVLDAYGVSFDSLSPQEKQQALEAVNQMAVDAKGEKVTEEEANRDRNANKNQSKTVTRTIKGKKEIVVPIAALQGKGYPAPVDLNAGTRLNKPLNMNPTATAPTSATNANSTAANLNSANTKTANTNTSNSNAAKR